MDIKDILDKLQITQQELGDFTGIPRGRISYWISKKTQPVKYYDIAQLNKASEILSNLVFAQRKNAVTNYRLISGNMVPIAEADAMGTSSSLKDMEHNSFVQEPSAPYNVARPSLKISPFNETHTDINRDWFAAALPTTTDSKGWIPYYNSAHSLFTEISIASENNKSLNIWPMLTHVDELYRMPHTVADLVVNAPASDNMEPVIGKNARIALKHVSKDMIFFGFPYLVLFEDMQYFVFYIQPGKDEEHVQLCSRNNDAYPPRNISLSKIKAVYLVKTSSNAIS